MLAVVPAPVRLMPKRPSAEMTFPAPAVVPPTRVPVTPEIRIPSSPLPTAVVPAPSTPMWLVRMVVLFAPGPPMAIPYFPLNEIVLLSIPVLAAPELIEIPLALLFEMTLLLTTFPFEPVPVMETPLRLLASIRFTPAALQIVLLLDRA